MMDGPKGTPRMSILKAPASAHRTMWLAQSALPSGTLCQRWLVFAFAVITVGCGAAHDNNPQHQLKTQAKLWSIGFDNPLNASTRESSNIKAWDHTNEPTAIIPTGHEHLSFRSEFKKFSSRDSEIGLRLGGQLLGGRVQAAIKLSFQNATSLILHKTPKDPDSRIFADANGRLDVRPDEDFVALCDYAASAATGEAKDFRLSLAGLTVETEHGSAQLYEVSWRNAGTAVKPGDSLHRLEQACIEQFDADIESQLHADLRTALTLKLQIDRHGDPYVEAVRALISGKPFRLDDGHESWYLKPANIVEQTGNVEVSGEFWHTRWMQNEHFRYRMLFDADDAMRLMSSEIWPQGNTQRQVERIAQLLATNAAGWHLAKSRQRPFTINTAMLSQ